jgi:hypothetical protein
MIKTIGYTALSIPTGFYWTTIIDYFHYRFYRTHISQGCKYSILLFIVCGGFLYGYTGNDLVTNIINWYSM